MMATSLCRDSNHLVKRLPYSNQFVKRLHVPCSLSAEEEMLQQRQKMFEALGYSESVAAAAYPIEVRSK